jgi:hypothetical protein
MRMSRGARRIVKPVARHPAFRLGGPLIGPTATSSRASSGEEDQMRALRQRASSTQGEGSEPRIVDGAVSDGEQSAEPPQLVQAATGIAVALCLAISVFHLAAVFLHVAPANPISQRYGKQIDAWIYPVFEQNWKLFAPDPETVSRQISARTKRTSATGVVEVSEWFDLTAVDDSAVKHNFFPSHTTNNLLRRAWTAYLDTHGNDDQPHSERARMVQEYLRNIAVDRVAGHRGDTFEAIQLRVITRAIPPPTTRDGPRPATSAAAETRELPWWTVANR